MGTSDLKEEIHALIEKANQDVLELIFNILSPSEKVLDMNPEQVAELERRYSVHLKNPEAGSSWIEVKNRISKKN